MRQLVEIETKNRYKIYFCTLLFFLCYQNSVATECVRLYTPFESTVKDADIAVAGEIICVDEETGYVFVKVTERFFGDCQDTIRCFDNGWGVAFTLSKLGDKVILALPKINEKDNVYYFDECGTYVLFFDDNKEKYFGNITNFNGFLCNTLAQLRIYKCPINYKSYQQIEKIAKRKRKNITPSNNN